MIVGVDTNILCYAFDPAYVEYKTARDLLLSLSPDVRLAINPTIVHESYHTLVFGQKWRPSEAKLRLNMLLRHPYVEFYNQTRTITIIALNLAVKHGLGGRDALIIGNFLANRIPKLLTHDGIILRLKQVIWKRSRIAFEDPVE